MDEIKYIDCTDDELSSILETKEEMMESIKSALASPTLPQEIKDYIHKNFESNPNPNNKEYTKFVLGLLNYKNEDFKITLKIIIAFTSEDNISILMKKRLIKSNFKKGELETLASNIQFGLDCYDNKERYFNNYIKSMIEFIQKVFNEKLLPFIINKSEMNEKFFDDFTLEKYDNKDNKLILIKFWKKIYYYVYKALNKEMDKDLIDDPGVFELRSLLRNFYEDSKDLSKKDKIEKAHEYKEDMQKLFKKYDWYSLLSAINSTDDVDRKVVFFLDLIAGKIFENWQNKSYSDILYIWSSMISISTKWHSALVDEWNEDPYCEMDLTDCSSGSNFLKAVDDRLVMPSGTILIKKSEDKSTLKQPELNFQQVALNDSSA